MDVDEVNAKCPKSTKSVCKHFIVFALCDCECRLSLSLCSRKDASIRDEIFQGALFFAMFRIITTIITETISDASARVCKLKYSERSRHRMRQPSLMKWISLLCASHHCDSVTMWIVYISAFPWQILSFSAVDMNERDACACVHALRKRTLIVSCSTSSTVCRSMHSLACHSNMHGARYEGMMCDEKRKLTSCAAVPSPSTSSSLGWNASAHLTWMQPNGNGIARHITRCSIVDSRTTHIPFAFIYARTFVFPIHSQRANSQCRQPISSVSRGCHSDTVISY